MSWLCTADHDRTLLNEEFRFCPQCGKRRPLTPEQALPALRRVLDDLMANVMDNVIAIEPEQARKKASAIKIIEDLQRELDDQILSYEINKPEPNE